MASLSPPATTTTTNISSLQPSPLFHKASQVSLVGKRNPRFVRRVVSCNATNGDERSTSSSKSGESPLGKLDRRNVLLGLGGLYGVSGLGAADPFAFAAPISPPDLSECGAADLPAGAQPTNCCPPVSSKIIDFKLPPKNSPFRIRPAAHLASKEYIAKYKKAIELMKALPDDDPRSFMQQADVHCAYCNGAYHQVGFPDLDLQFVKFDIFINDEDDPVSRPDNTEFAGSFVNVPHQHSHGKKKNTILRIGISELLEDLEAEDDDSVVVTLVPRYGADVITIGGIEIELAS
uniref:Polyphenol oxidase C-terminal domain-containing protein n=1 Tax=Vitis vinifera TaxID=29760 RepID=F6I2B6_VITVI